MPKTLSNRLEKLQNDLHVMLMLQQVSSKTDRNKTKSASTYTTSPQPTQHAKRVKPYEHRLNSYINNHGSPKQESSKQFVEHGGTSVSSFSSIQQTNTYKSPISISQNPGQTSVKEKKEVSMNMKFTYSPPGVQTRSKTKQKYHIKHECESEAHTQTSISGSLLTKAAKVTENVKFESGINDFVVSEKYDDTKKELEVERDKCGHMEQTVDRLRNVLESNRVTIQDMIQSKKLALDMAKKLRDKYETIRTSRRGTLLQLEQLKLENSKLDSKLQQEVNAKNTLNVQLEILQANIVSSNSAKIEVERKLNAILEDNNLLQNKIDEFEKRAKETEKLAQNKENDLKKELKRRLSVENPEIQELMKNELSKFKITLDRQTKASKKNLEENSKALEEVECRCVMLENKLKSAQDADNEKCSQAEAEFQKVKAMMEEKENLMQTERKELEHLVQELTEMVKQNKNRITELTEINKQQEALIQTQTEVISSKGEQLVLANREVEMMGRQISELESQVLLLRHSVEMYDKMKDEWTIRISKHESEHKQHEAKKEVLEREVLFCRSVLDTEKDKLLIKDKIIEDQNASIKQLKNALNEKTDELRRFSKDWEQVERELSQEKVSRQKLISKTNELQWSKEQLEEHVAELQEELNHVDKGSTTDYEKHQHMLLTLEKQVNSKQKEWELQLKLMNREKEQAVNAARFATQKLLESTRDFQKQVVTQKKVQRMLTALLSEKEAEIKKANDTVDFPSTNTSGIMHCNSCIEASSIGHSRCHRPLIMSVPNIAPKCRKNYLQKTHYMQHNFEVKLLRAREAVSEVIKDVSKTKHGIAT